MFLVDSHCHLDKLNYKSLHKDVVDVLNKANLKNVKLILAVATTLEDFYKTRVMVSSYDNVLLSCGIHPLNFNNFQDLIDLNNLAIDEDIIAIGETGLDYYHNTKDNKEEQKEAFRQHIRIARKYQKPLIVHTRNSSQDVIDIFLHEEKLGNCSGVIHCFNESKDVLKLFLDIGFYISFSGIITFNLSKSLRDVIHYIPLDYLLVETDSPYLTPAPYRGQENQPSYTYYVANCLAKLKNMSLEKLSYITTENFYRLFQIR
ncbi:YchF/TatD family DNA exonuclease [Blochmannia endosymbiont of Colobopsis nipponica]|uniref:YchF/TatD family DNA exonuclease n=1 Tax=Blochmannia endosymbiont of Colobopsis nipponica TaxID=2681987 RepID=UPI00177BF6FE|nr:YchF/TatD family DNA exonuclease [Blochmannia endosymbiont of Colobopsis nipponica]QOI11053.1 YchF/TatD family DNA exonuclease [Blochmannia endosymbiont of Colobopsis nipponica]